MKSAAVHKCNAHLISWKTVMCEDCGVRGLRCVRSAVCEDCGMGGLQCVRTSVHVGALPRSEVEPLNKGHLRVATFVL